MRNKGYGKNKNLPVTVKTKKEKATRAIHVKKNLLEILKTKISRRISEQ